jgi:hypothetical protein
VPSTFTTNTGIEKIADGEQTGLWGQTTNLNFDIVDRALNGAVEVTLSGSTYTLTTSSGVLSEGQAAAIVFVGSPAGPVTVTVAPDTAQKTYLLRNSSGVEVTITQGSGGNVVLPNGISAVVVCTGGGASSAVLEIARGPIAGVSTNTPDTLVQRDGSGNFSAGTITAALTGNVTGNVTGNADTATAWQTGRTLTVGATGKTLDGTANVSFNATEIGITKADVGLADVDNVSAANLRDRATHTGTQAPSTIALADGPRLVGRDGSGAGAAGEIAAVAPLTLGSGNASIELAPLTENTAPGADDLLLLELASGGAKRKVKFSNIAPSGSSYIYATGQVAATTNPVSITGFADVKRVNISGFVSSVSSNADSSSLEIRFSTDNGSTWGSYQNIFTNAAVSEGSSASGTFLMVLDFVTGAYLRHIETPGNATGGRSASGTLTVPSGANAFGVRVSRASSSVVSIIVVGDL